jgi:hypothetical protein
VTQSERWQVLVDVLFERAYELRVEDEVEGALTRAGLFDETCMLQGDPRPAATSSSSYRRACWPSSSAPSATGSSEPE